MFPKKIYIIRFTLVINVLSLWQQDLRWPQCMGNLEKKKKKKTSSTLRSRSVPRTILVKCKTFNDILLFCLQLKCRFCHLSVRAVAGPKSALPYLNTFCMKNDDEPTIVCYSNLVVIAFIAFEILILPFAIFNGSVRALI